jgi:3-methyladenine DNA glycosylase AlkC
MAGLSKENPLKNVFNRQVIAVCAGNIKRVYPAFKEKKFINSSAAKLRDLGFLGRSLMLRDKIKEYLPESYTKAVKILIKALGPELPSPGETVWESFYLMSQCAFVSEYGKKHYGESMMALYEMTKRFTAEGDLRTFLEVDFNRTIKLMHKWTKDPSPHVRRLVSEGLRPRLPLSARIPRFQKDPEPLIELLDKLKDDKELYVRRSVANNINDIAKDNPKIAIRTLGQWNKSKSKNVKWVVRHASRSLLKKGNAELLAILGYSPKVAIKPSKIILNKKNYKVGERMEFSFFIKSHAKKKEKLMIDYVVSFVKATGRSADKVFKMRDISIESNQILEIKKGHWLKNTSGRKHYPGRHDIALQINGKRYHRASFNIV